jgi:succinate dehydrogenase hydrophobic anchor subunit
MSAGARPKPGQFQWTMSNPSSERGFGYWLGSAITALLFIGWPFLFLLAQAHAEYRHWLTGIAMPWWVVVAGVALVVIVTKTVLKSRR